MSTLYEFDDMYVAEHDGHITFAPKGSMEGREWAKLAVEDKLKEVFSDIRPPVAGKAKDHLAAERSKPKPGGPPDNPGPPQ